jgi:lipid II:glycine glycyltransferase (peptidoglycan interpeptide bridge formation enzyme)
MMELCLDSKILKLQELERKLKMANAEYADIEEAIEEMNEDLEEAEKNCNDLENKIKLLKKEIELDKLNNLANSPESSFARDFYYAALFCSYDDDISPGLTCVKITEDMLLGCNRYSAIQVINKIYQST